MFLTECIAPSIVRLEDVPLFYLCIYFTCASIHHNYKDTLFTAFVSIVYISLTL